MTGAEFRAPVTGAGSQGYRWIVTVTGDAEAVEASVAGIPPSAATAAGSFARELRIQARRPGVARIGLALVHSGGRVREEHAVTVRVDPADGDAARAAGVAEPTAGLEPATP